MPIYEYQCDKCNEQFEQLIRGDEVGECPKGCGTNVRKLLSMPAAPVSKKSLPISRPAPIGGG